jgi:SAM-dependent methyltransferase
MPKRAKKAVKKPAKQQSTAEFWMNNKKMQHITPPASRFPEVGLFEALLDAVDGSVFELGCGDGRLAPAFEPGKYTGYDINPYAVERARKQNHLHTFTDEWVEADTILAYTVLLHISDDEIEEIIEKMNKYKRIVIGEIVGRKWRRAGNPPVFNREIKDYEALVGRECRIIKVDYPRYNCKLPLMIFE